MKRKEICSSLSTPNCTTGNKAASPISMSLRQKKASTSPSTSRKVRFMAITDYNDPECSGLWSSSNFVEIRGDPSKSVSYKVQTAVLYELNMLNEKTNEEMEVNDSVKKHVLYLKFRGLSRKDGPRKTKSTSSTCKWPGRSSRKTRPF